jgi:hypothetical protein
MSANLTPAGILQALRNDFEKSFEVPKKDKWKGPPSSSTIIRTFGSWSEAVKRAGINKDEIRRGKLITEMRKTVSELKGIVPSANDWGRNCYKPSSTCLTKIFGSWNNALLAAGLTLKEEMKSAVKEEDVLSAFKKYVDEHKVRPKVDDWREKDLQPSYPEIISLYGSWDNALRIIEANINATREESSQALRNFKTVKGSSPTVREWNDEKYWPSSSQIIRIFGSWNDALKISLELNKPMEQKDGENKVAKEECLRSLLNFKLEHDKWPSANNWRANNKLQPPARQIIRLFGKWSLALKAAEELEKDENRSNIDNDEKFEIDQTHEEKTDNTPVTIFQSPTYKFHLDQPKLLTIKEFVHELKLPMETFRVDEYWDAWENPSKFIVVDRDLLNWLGYEGKYFKQRQNALENLRNNFKSNYDFVERYTTGSINFPGAEKQAPNEKLIAVTYLCLSQWTMGMQTSRGREIRRQAADQQLFFKFYSRYQNDWQSRQQQRLLEAKIQQLEATEKEVVKLKKANARHEKKHKYVKFDIEDAAYYVFSYGRRCHKECITNDLRKHGVAIKDKKGSGPLDQRLRIHRTTLKWLMLELIIVAPPESIEVLEKSMEARFGKNLNPNSSEVFEGISLNVLKEVAISMLNLTCPGKYQVISQEKIDSYNQDVDLLIKEGVEAIQEENEEENEEENDQNDQKEEKEEKDEKEDKNSEKAESSSSSSNEKHSTINNISNPVFNNDNSVNVNVNVQVDLSELKNLLKDLETFTNKKLDIFLDKYDIPRHGNKDKKIEKLKTYINSKISEGSSILNKFGG